MSVTNLSYFNPLVDNQQSMIVSNLNSIITISNVIISNTTIQLVNSISSTLTLENVSIFNISLNYNSQRMINLDTVVLKVQNCTFEELKSVAPYLIQITRSN